jgi:hypothetical protein
LNDDRIALAFAALHEPCGEAFGETFWREAKAGFDFAVGNGESVIKFGGVGKVAHAELIEPIERAGAGFAADDYVDVEFLGVHERKIGDAARRATDYEVRGRLTEWARPTASSIQIKYQPMSV